MRITICGSMSFAREMIDFKSELEKMGLEVDIPGEAKDYAEDLKLKKQTEGWESLEGARRKIERDLIRAHYNKIKNSDAIFVINKDKKGIKNYIGGNSFLEIGFAYILRKKIFLLNPIPTEIPYFYQEIIAMEPIVLGGDLAKIK